MPIDIEWRKPHPAHHNLDPLEERWAEWRAIRDELMLKAGEWASLGPQNSGFMHPRKITGKLFGDKTKWEITTRSIKGSKDREVFIRYIG